MTKTTAPYGTWISPVTTKLMTEAAIGLSVLTVDHDDLYWLESRAHEAGRTALCKRSADGGISDIMPIPVSVGSRVHEYGGGAYAVKDGIIVFSERKEGSVWLIEPDTGPSSFATPEGCRYADFEFDFPRRRVLAIREDHRDRPPTDPKAAIVALSLDGEAETILVEGPDFLSSPRLSPDGQKLAWISWNHPDMPWDASELLLADVSADGSIGKVENLTGPIRQSIVQPRWSDDGILHFSSDRTGWWNLYALRSGAIEPIAPIEAEIGGPHWVFGQRSYSFLPDGRIIAMVSQNGIRTAAIIDGGKIVPLDIGQVHEAPLALGEGLAYIATPRTQSPFVAVLPSLSDGAPIIIRSGAPAVLPEGSISIGEPMDFPTRGAIGHAFWYPPKNEAYEGQAGSLPPLVVLSHGGPTSMTTNGFSLAIQWWTTRGFGVVDVNYGGSTGFGRPYREALNGTWGIVDVEDCAAAAKALADRGLVDRDRIVIRGGSAGGFTTLAALTSTNVFRAGASLYGVADLKLLASDTHKFESRYLDGLIGPLPQADALYIERSPIHHIDRLTCPLIFFQGQDDKTVPPNQAETMVEAIAARGLPVAYYSFEGEGHGFRQAETLRRVLDLELGFYGRVFGFTTPGLSEEVVIRNEIKKC
ncbi:S9 family peptidase [Methyloferula stellata]|uniref:S9 family peptidase n=1 Tax=Methyloferula stellata TaxID=876270 RepID=UPI0003A98C2A|nr:prolyl oligopeptidase family serine peptidase [Methyloferula stellata]